MNRKLPIKSLIKFSFLSVLLILHQPVRAEFIYGSTGTRSSGLGGAFIAIDNSPESIFYNPAGIANSRSWNLSAGYSDLFTGSQINGMHLFHLATTFGEFDFGDLGTGITSFSMLNYQELQIYFTYAREIVPNLFFGLSPKLLRWASTGYEGKDPIYNIYVKDKDFSKVSLSVDAGIIYKIYGDRPGLISGLVAPGNLSLALALRDFLSPNISSNGNVGGKIPPTIEAGFAYSYRSVLLATSFQKRGGYSKIFGGVEYKLKKISTDFGEYQITIRGGGTPALIKDSTSELDGGFTLQFRNYQIHYSLSQKIEMAGLGITHSIAFQYQF